MNKPTKATFEFNGKTFKATKVKVEQLESQNETLTKKT
jgi:hypothetical protein